MNEALELFDTAQAQGAPVIACAPGRWTCWMLLGQFERAWQESDLLDRAGFADPSRFWDGRSFEGRHVLLRALHGYGDAVQFVRYAPLIRRRARELTIQCHPALLELMTRVDGVDRVITWPDPPPPLSWDQQIEVMELPRAFRTEVTSIPARTPYICVEPELMHSAFSGLAETEQLKVGLIWESSQYDPSRSIPFAAMALVLTVPGVRFLSFQHRPVHAPALLYEAIAPDGAVLETASRLSQIDLLLTVDTFGAHLAGALGVPVWMMLPFAADWRWMLERTDSPWYPGMRLFRQPAPGAWAPVIDTVRQELDARSRSAP